LEQEGGVAARERRYRQNHETLMKGMAQLGIQPYLPSDVQSCIITAFHTPKDPCFSFDVFYRKLSARGFIIYPGKLTKVDTFRIGNIGRIFPSDIEQLVYAVGETMEEIRSSKPEIRSPKPEVRNPSTEFRT